MSASETIVDLANAVPPGEWVTYGTIGKVKKAVTGTGNGRGAAQALQAHRNQVRTWHRIRNADGRLVASSKNDPWISDQWKGHWTSTGGFVLTDPSHPANLDFVAEGGNVDSTGAATGSEWDIEAYTDVATTVVQDALPRTPSAASRTDVLLADRRAAFEARFGLQHDD